MAFALWIDGELAWAQGLHEYRPMGVAVVAVTDRFRPRDFNPSRQAPARGGKSFAGLYASIGELNRCLRRIRDRSLRSRLSYACSEPRPKGAVRRKRRATPAWIGQS